MPSPVLAAKLHTTLRSAAKSAEADKFSAAWLKDNPKDVAFRIYLADAMAAFRDYAGAEKMYLNIVQIDPNNASVLNNLAWVSGKLNNNKAISYAEKAISVAPKQAAYLDTLAEIYSDKKDYAKALEWQNKAVALAPQSPIYKLNLAKIHIKGGKKDLARKELEDLAKLGDKFAGQSQVTAMLKTL